MITRIFHGAPWNIRVIIRLADHGGHYLRSCHALELPR
jgi:hypothetical protein